MGGVRGETGGGGLLRYLSRGGVRVVVGVLRYLARRGWGGGLGATSVPG